VYIVAAAHRVTSRGQLVCNVVGPGVTKVFSFPIYAPSHPNESFNRAVHTNASGDNEVITSAPKYVGRL
jgi:hypothetical protein